ncbi:zinc finger CW-type PWWP domain protein 1 isoform X2 [Xenopus tropicalis]|nr:zinc finger CW-type PWWP domain protein 1 isoform X2 [Xenopus tropicalis]
MYPQRAKRRLRPEPLQPNHSPLARMAPHHRVKEEPNEPRIRGKIPKLQTSEGTLSSRDYEEIFGAVLGNPGRAPPQVTGGITDAGDVDPALRVTPWKHKRNPTAPQAEPPGSAPIESAKASPVGPWQRGVCVAWVQCAEPNCKKWRRLGQDVDPLLLPEDWCCEQNMESQYRSCAEPEEPCSGDVDLIYAAFIPGCLVWAKQSGYPWWPAMIDSDPDSAYFFKFKHCTDPLPWKYHVTFLGDAVSRAWICSSHLKPFRDHSPESLKVYKEKNQELKKMLVKSIGMANAVLSLGIQERLHSFGFCRRSGLNV